jgi:hypothetical protein
MPQHHNHQEVRRPDITRTTVVDVRYRRMLQKHYPHIDSCRAYAPYSWWAHHERNPQSHSQWDSAQTKEK